MGGGGDGHCPSLPLRLRLLAGAETGGAAGPASGKGSVVGGGLVERWL